MRIYYSTSVHTILSSSFSPAGPSFPPLVHENINVHLRYHESVWVCIMQVCALSQMCDFRLQCVYNTIHACSVHIRAMRSLKHFLSLCANLTIDGPRRLTSVVVSLASIQGSPPNCHNSITLPIK